MAVTADAKADGAAARGALRDEVARVTALLRSISDSQAPALGSWNIAEVAMHLSQAFVVVPGLARADLSEAYEVLPTGAGRDSGALIEDLWELGDVTTHGVKADVERDLQVIAGRIDERAAGFLGYIDNVQMPADDRPWLVEGVEVELATLVCHLLNETIVHGYDIGRAAGRKWPIQPAHAAMVLDGFLMPLIAILGPRTMVDQQKAAGLRACYDIRVRRGGRHFMVFDDGALSVEKPSDRAVDCHLSVDPAAFLLVAWGRTSQWRAIGRGQLLAWGRRPWLGPRLRSLMRNP